MAFTAAPAHWTEEGYNDATLDKTGTGEAIALVAASACKGPSGTIAEGHRWRVDRQNPSLTEANLQVQRNGQFPPATKTSVGGAFVAKALVDAIGNINSPDAKAKATAQARHKELTRAVHSALSQSVNTWAIGGGPHNAHGRFRFYRVTGTFSS